MTEKLARKIGFLSLFLFALPNILSEFVIELYAMVDGFFVANFAGSNALPAVNIAWPLLMIIASIGVMLGTGGSALIAKQLGEGKTEEARQNFTLIVLSCIVIGVGLSLAVMIFKEPLFILLGADSTLMPLCLEYTLPFFFFIPGALISWVFNIFFITEGYPKITFIMSLLGAVTNLGFDYLFIVVFQMGLTGAAIATGIAYSIPMIFGLFFFSRKSKRTLYFTRPALRLKVISKSAGNGASEMITLVSTSVMVIVMNNIVIRIAGIDGVAALTIIMYAQYLFASLYLGYADGIAPIVSYHFGKRDDDLAKIHKINLILVAVLSILTFAVCMILNPLITGAFVCPESAVYTMAVTGLFIFAPSFLFEGINIYASAFFTALNNGRVSAILSFSRTVVFMLLTLFTLPVIFGLNGLWVSMPVAQVLAFIMAVFFLVHLKKVYHY